MPQYVTVQNPNPCNLYFRVLYTDFFSLFDFSVYIYISRKTSWEAGFHAFYSYTGCRKLSPLNELCRLMIIKFLISYSNHWSAVLNSDNHNSVISLTDNFNYHLSFPVQELNSDLLTDCALYSDTYRLPVTLLQWFFNWCATWCDTKGPQVCHGSMGEGRKEAS
jgi:hypothetical protein